MLEEPFYLVIYNIEKEAEGNKSFGALGDRLGSTYGTLTSPLKYIP